MDLFIFIMIFIAGTVFGSFYSLAVYRIPRKENITYVQSHCVSCNHKLGPKDLIPIWSYIFLRGRCRYCKDKIRSRYVMLEVTSGLTFLLIAIFLKINAFSSILEFLNLFVTYLFITAVFIIGGIDKEHHIVPDSLILYSIGVSIAKLIINAFMGIHAISNLIGFLIIPLLIFVIQKKKKKVLFDFGYVKYLAIIGLFLGVKSQLIIILSVLILDGIEKILHKDDKLPLGFCMSIATVVVTILSSQLTAITSSVF